MAAAVLVQAQADLGGLDAPRGAPHQLRADRALELVQVVAHVGAAHLAAGARPRSGCRHRGSRPAGSAIAGPWQIGALCQKFFDSLSTGHELSRMRALSRMRVHAPANRAGSPPGDTQHGHERRSPSAVTFQRQADVLVVTIDNPPVNALGVDVRRGLVAAIDAAEADGAVAAVLIVGAGRNFIAGADIREFGKPPQPPSLPEVCNRIESLQQAGGRRDPRRRARRRAGDRAVGALPAGRGRRQARPARSAAGPAARRRRHAARAAPDRRQGRARPDAERPPRRRQGSAGARPGRPPGPRAPMRWPKAWPTRRSCVAAKAPVRRTRDATRRWPTRPPAAPRSKPRAPTPRRRARGLFSPMKIVEAVEAALDAALRRGHALRARAVPAMHRQPAARRPDPRLLRRARSASRRPRRKAAQAARRSRRPASSAAAPWARASRSRCSMPACR